MHLRIRRLVPLKQEGRVRGFGSDSFDEITSEVEKARLNLPDPFVIDELSYVLPANQLGRIFSGNIGIKNLVLAGMKGFKFKASTFPPLIDFHLPHAKLDVDYNLDLAAFGVASLKVNGNGHFS
ncbi:unnamed protein product [Acanthoscelides obtectus]|uniref:Uncharacterized protein n=1 Tax=Acanthoscelides obtectus TaxID=200917 RepID=A0A9P0KD09_ACAOB|nr:unnamed protein product [Acanthoscelides obtectus]CAK1667464.1 hypothetical protein AOBTE_LOCUS25858 [Acanthoscelides obtectus]